MNAVENSGLSQKSDGGAAVYTEGAPLSGSLIPADVAAKYPVGQQARMFVLGGGVRGFGMLAAYDTPGKRSFVIARRTKLGGTQPYVPFALARVFDPKGNLVGIEDFTDQTEETTYRTIEINKGMPGIWRVSFSGGRKDDLVEIRMKDTPFWGVRGEMALGVTETTPRPAYLWIPPSSKKLLVGLESGSPEGVELRDHSGKNVLVPHPEDDPTHRIGRMVLDPAPANTICRVELPSQFNGAVVVEGAPGLLCPNEKAARRLLGGTVESRGLCLAGPLQARAREWMVAHASKLELEPKFNLPTTIPEGLPSPQIAVLGFSASGPLNCINWVIAQQNKNLDPGNPFFGGFGDPKPGELDQPTWQNFLPTRFICLWEIPSLAAAASFQSPLNTAYGNKDLIERTTLAVFSHFASMQGDDLLREGNLFTGRYPVTHSFFVYQAQAQAYVNLKDKLPPDARAIWKEGLFAVGDKLADHQGYQSNQWTHVLRGHLDVYLATGEKRFLRYFERLATAYLDDTFGPNSKFGQHPAGYYLEECGPDGNYDKLNSFTVNTWYQDYRDLPEANPELVQKLKKSIEMNLRFCSFFWMPQPDGEIVSPNGFNCRTTAGLGGNGYPGAFLGKSEFPLAAARFALTASPKNGGAGDAWVFSFLANTDGWIRETLTKGLAAGPGGLQQAGGGWLHALVKAYSLPQTAKPAVLPYQENGGTWELPGLVAWNRGGIYGVVFYDVVGADHRLPGNAGGGPTSLWMPSTGTFLASMQPGRPPESLAIKDKEALTFSCVYGNDGEGNLFYSGKERAEIKVLEEGKHYEINTKPLAPITALTWGYVLGENDLEMSVQSKALGSVKAQYVNLPLLKRLPDTRIHLDGKNALVFETAHGAVRMEWSAAYEGELQPSTRADIQRLVIAIPSDGTPLVIKMKSTPLGTQP